MDFKFYESAFDGSKLQAQAQIHGDMQALGMRLVAAIDTLKSSGQKVPFELNDAVETLRRAKMSWLKYEDEIFESAIAALKDRISQAIK